MHQKSIATNENNFLQNTEVYVKRIKPLSLHLSLVAFVFLYASLGGLVIQKLEFEAIQRQTDAELRRKQTCVTRILKELSMGIISPTIIRSNNTMDNFFNCFHVEVDERSQWSMVTGTLYGFGIITTLGYNRIEPKTLESRIFCVVYGIIGIPITMIIIANIGQYLNQFAGDTRRRLEAHFENKRRYSKQSISTISESDVPDSTTEWMAMGLLITFLVYVCIGAILLQLLNGELDFLNGIYYNFLCLTAIDFGQLVPNKFIYLPITFTYVCVGLAITTIAINVGSEYVKKLHHFGKRVKNVASTKIWFGGKTQVFHFNYLHTCFHRFMAEERKEFFSSLI